MNRLRRVIVAAAACALLGMSAASASMLQLTSRAVGAGEGTVVTCDTDGVTITYTSAFDTTVADYRTTAATVSGIAAGCSGRTLNLTVRGATGTSLWQTTATVSGTSMNLVASTALQSSAIAGWAVSVTG
ncbi:MAG: hypothetical protein JWM05_2888 [Acidimicrobiales bacterium]|nr:hypothetical protein [Acidimicrobiales bacterium]